MLTFKHVNWMETSDGHLIEDSDQQGKKDAEVAVLYS